MTDIIEHDDVDTMRVTVPGFGIAAHTLRDLLTAALVAAGKDSDGLPVLATIRLEWDDTELRAVSTDRYRLLVARVVHQDGYSQRDGSMFAPNGDGEALVSRNDVAELVKALPKLSARGGTTVVRVSVIADSVLVEGDGWSRTLPLVLGEFPKYRSLIPGEDKFGPVDNVTYNPKFLADIGKIPVVKGTPVRFRFTEQNRPMVATLKGANGVEDYLYMLMPVRTVS